MPPGSSGLYGQRSLVMRRSIMRRKIAILASTGTLFLASISSARHQRCKAMPLTSGVRGVCPETVVQGFQS